MRRLWACFRWGHRRPGGWWAVPGDTRQTVNETCGDRRCSAGCVRLTDPLYLRVCEDSSSPPASSPRPSTGSQTGSLLPVPLPLCPEPQGRLEPQTPAPAPGISPPRNFTLTESVHCPTDSRAERSAVTREWGGSDGRGLDVFPPQAAVCRPRGDTTLPDDLCLPPWGPLSLSLPSLNRVPDSLEVVSRRPLCIVPVSVRLCVFVVRLCVSGMCLFTSLWSLCVFVPLVRLCHISVRLLCDFPSTDLSSVGLLPAG